MKKQIHKNQFENGQRFLGIDTVSIDNALQKFFLKTCYYYWLT